MEHFPQKALQIGRVLGLLWIYVLYSTYKEALQHNSWATHVFIASISFFFSCSIFLCVVSAFSVDNESRSVKTTVRALIGYLLRVSPVFLISVVLYSCFVRDTLLDLVDELYFQVGHMMLYGYPSTLIVPLPPLYMVAWLVAMDILLHLTCLLVVPLVRLIGRSTARVRVTHSNWTRLIGGFTVWLIWYGLLYYPTKYSLRVDGLATPDTIIRLAHYIPIRCGEYVFVALASYLSACSLGLAQTFVADIFLNHACLLVASTLSLLTVTLLPFAGFTPITVLAQWYLTPIIIPAVCILLHILTKMALSSHHIVMGAPEAVPLSASVHSDTPGAAASQSLLLVLAASLISSPTLSLLVQCSFEMICMYPVGWVIAYALNPQRSPTYHILFSLPFMVASAILIHVGITAPACALVHTDVERVDLHLPAHKPGKAGRHTSLAGLMRSDGYAPVKISANASCD